MVKIKFRFYSHLGIPSVSLETSDEIEEDSWMNDSSIIFIYSLNENGMFYNAIKIVYNEDEDVFYCNGFKRQHLETYDICDDDQMIIYSHFDEEILSKRNIYNK